jgi:hypothetical protein
VLYVSVPITAADQQAEAFKRKEKEKWHFMLVTAASLLNKQKDQKKKAISLFLLQTTFHVSTHPNSIPSHTASFLLVRWALWLVTHSPAFSSPRQTLHSSPSNLSCSLNQHKESMCVFQIS